MPIQNEVLKMLASGTVAAGLYSRSPAAQLRKEERAVTSLYKTEPEHSGQIQEQAAAADTQYESDKLFAQSAKQSYAASEDYYNLAQKTSGSKQAKYLAKSYEAAQRAASTVEFLDDQQKQLLLARAAVMGPKEYQEISDYMVEDKVVKKKPKAEEKK